MSKVFVKDVHSYSPDEIRQAVDVLFAQQNVQAMLRPGMKVVIKPNLLAAEKPEKAVTTHPELLSAVIVWLNSHGVENVLIAESPGGAYTAAALKHIYSVCGLTNLKGSYTLNYDTSWETVSMPEGFSQSSMNIIRPILEADLVINMCKLKTHAMTRMSAGIKNLFGTLPGLQKPEMHYRCPKLEQFSTMLVELAQYVHPGLTVIDGIVGMEGNGPGSGTPKYLGALLCSEDVFSQDWYAAKLMGYDPESVSTLCIARDKGLIRPDEIEVIGDPVQPANPPFVLPDAISHDFVSVLPAFLRKPARAVLRTALTPYPHVQKKICIGCGKCAESCPQKIIQIKDKKATMPKKGCISCFCCQEMCPAHAIKAKRKIKL